MEENKYYTPSIEEFHVGFEYEYIPCENNVFTTWEKRIFNKDSFEGLTTWYSYIFNSNRIRTKYLDKEDIESLCIKEEDKDVFLLKNDFDETEYDILLRIDYEKHFVEIMDRGDGFNSEYFFQGTIKNKSELKKVLQMIGVL